MNLANKKQLCAIVLSTLVITVGMGVNSKSAIAKQSAAGQTSAGQTTNSTTNAGQTTGADDFDPSRFNPAQFKEYERQLNAILRTRRDEEKQFVAKVVSQVRDGKIPSKLVDTSYKWVHEKRPFTNYPFLYFEKVLRLQATKLKLQKEVPPFDYSIYGSAGQQTIGQIGVAGQRKNRVGTANSKSAGQTSRR